MFDPDQFHDPEFRSLVRATRAVVAERCPPRRRLATRAAGPSRPSTRCPTRTTPPRCGPRRPRPRSGMRFAPWCSRRWRCTSASSSRRPTKPTGRTPTTAARRCTDHVVAAGGRTLGFRGTAPPPPARPSPRTSSAPPSERSSSSRPASRRSSTPHGSSAPSPAPHGRSGRSPARRRPTAPPPATRSSGPELAAARSVRTSPTTSPFTNRTSRDSPSGFVLPRQTVTSTPSPAAASATSPQRRALTSLRRIPAMKRSPAITASSRPRARATSSAATPRPLAGGEDGGQVRRPEGARLAPAALTGGPPVAREDPGRSFPRQGPPRRRGGP